MEIINTDIELSQIFLNDILNKPLNSIHPIEISMNIEEKTKSKTFTPRIYNQHSHPPFIVIVEKEKNTDAVTEK